MNGPNPPRERLATVAARAARAGGEFLADSFRTGHVSGEYGVDDVKADADVAAERRVLSVIDDAFPGHATHGEESGHVGESDTVWVVDPLDGTNNFAADFPAFATAVTCVHDGAPQAAAIYEPLPDTMYTATRDGGAVAAPADVAVDPDRSGDRLAADSDVPLEHGTVSYLVGVSAVREPALRETADLVGEALDAECKRVLESWSPCVDWGMLAAGGSQGVVCFHPDVYEQYPGSLLAAESGAAIREDEGNGLFVAAPTDTIAETLFETARATIRREA